MLMSWILYQKLSHATTVGRWESVLNTCAMGAYVNMLFQIMCHSLPFRKVHLSLKLVFATIFWNLVWSTLSQHQFCL
jgi:hypothetical protein